MCNFVFGVAGGCSIVLMMVGTWSMVKYLIKDVKRTKEK